MRKMYPIIINFLARLLGAQSPTYQTLFTFLRRHRRVGADPLGNVYYEAPPRPGYSYTRRWIAYKDRPDPSAVPPRWHAWLHHQISVFPTEDAPCYAQSWQKPHTPNSTGTPDAWYPPGSLERGQTRARASGDYTPWKPKDTKT